MPIAIVSVPVSDPDRAKRFYEEVLGFKLLRESPMGPTMRWIQLSAPGGGSTISLVTWFDQMKPGSLQGVLLDVPNVDEERTRMTGVLKADLPAVAEEPWGRYTMLKDPDGNGWIVATLTERT